MSAGRRGVEDPVAAAERVAPGAVRPSQAAITSVASTTCRPAGERIGAHGGQHRLDEAEAGDDPDRDSTLPGGGDQPADGFLADERMARHRVDDRLAGQRKLGQRGRYRPVDLVE